MRKVEKLDTYTKEEEKSEESEKHQRKRQLVLCDSASSSSPRVLDCCASRQRSRSRSVPVEEEAARKASSSSGRSSDLSSNGKQRAPYLSRTHDRKRGSSDLEFINAVMHVMHGFCQQVCLGCDTSTASRLCLLLKSCGIIQFRP